MQAMGHTDPNIYRRHYLNQIVTTDTLACFLETPSRQGIMRLASPYVADSRRQLTNRPCRKAQIDEIRADPVLCAAKDDRDILRGELVKQYRHLKVAREADPSGYTQYKQRQRAAKAVDMKLRRKALTKVRDRFFCFSGCSVH